MVEAIEWLSAAHRALLHGWRGVGEQMLVGAERLTALNARHASAAFEAAGRMARAPGSTTLHAHAVDPTVSAFMLPLDYAREAITIQANTAQGIADVLMWHAHGSLDGWPQWLETIHMPALPGGLPFFGVAFDALDLACRAMGDANDFTQPEERLAHEEVPTEAANLRRRA